MPYKYTITKDDYIAAQRLHMRRNKYVQIAVLAAILANLFLFFHFFAHEGIEAAIMRSLVVLCLALLFLLLMRWALRWLWRRLYKKQRSLHQEMEMTFDENGIEFKGEIVSGKIAWQAFIKTQENSELILLYENENLMHILPRRAFGSAADAEQFLVTAKKHIESNGPT